ncbi:conserved protein of unknown function [Citrobacter amalonaticus]|nr:conserved protein of unknown function [Citrobacter amalonaticus]
MISFTDQAVFLDKIPSPSTDKEKVIKMENNSRTMPHIRRTTHIMMFAHRNSFDFHFFNAR